jgi:hypothetical protein
MKSNIGVVKVRNLEATAETAKENTRSTNSTNNPYLDIQELFLSVFLDCPQVQLIEGCLLLLFPGGLHPVKKNNKLSKLRTMKSKKRRL